MKPAAVISKTGEFRVPDEPAGTLHLYLWPEAGATGRRLSASGFVWSPFEVDLFDDEAVVAPCGQCRKPAVLGWTTGTATAEVCCSACVTLHEGPREPCVLFHKWNKRCWSDAALVGQGWSPARAEATVYPTRAAAAAAKETFLEPVQKAIMVVPVAGFDAAVAAYLEES